MKDYEGKAIYNPSGKAGEYSYWACNFYVGCSNVCEYCYLKKGILNHFLGGDKPTLKKRLKDEAHALNIFRDEITTNLIDLQKNGLFFSFTTDPMLPDTIQMTIKAIELCNSYHIHTKILTKRADWLHFAFQENYVFTKHYTSFGFTLTGHDELEPNASTNDERVEAMRKLHDAGFKTFASVEPVIDFKSSLEMIKQTKDFCDLYKIGLKSGGKYDRKEIQNFVVKVLNLFSFIPNQNEYVARKMLNINPIKAYEFTGKIYFKDILLKQAGISRDNLPSNCVTRDYNIFNEKKDENNSNIFRR